LLQNAISKLNQVPKFHIYCIKWAVIKTPKIFWYIRDSIINRMFRITTLDFRRANSGLFQHLLGGIPQVRALESRGLQESWSLFKHHFLHARDRCSSMSKKSSKARRRPAQISKELLAKLKWKRKVYGMWKEGQAT